ncbi:MAG TPA: hypothetical protein VFJ96_14505, partial [Gemmatimonadaceae bacterium]|nr:hypothetical protein [Gemmatimonadaceae bacterium]
HYGHREAVNQLTIPAVDPTVKIPEYKECAAAVETLAAIPEPLDRKPTENLTPENAPQMFPYTTGITGASTVKGAGE